MADAKQRIAVVERAAGLLPQLAGALQRGLGHPHRHAGHQRTRVIEGFHDPGETLPHIDLGIPQQVGGWHPAVAEADGGGIRGLDAKLLLQAGHRHARRALFHHEGLDGCPAQATIQGGPDHHGIGTLAGGDEDLLAVEDVVLAILDGRGADGRRIRTAARLGDRHGRPGAFEARELLLVGHGGDGGIAQPLARHGQQQPDIAPAEFHHPQQRGQVAAITHALLGRRTALAGGTGADGLRGAGVHPIQQGRQQVQLAWIGMFGLVVLARQGTEVLGSHLMGLITQGAEFLRNFQVHAALLTDADRRSSRRWRAGRDTSARPGAPG
ncbi:hypothetical protein D3C84_502010 [compost metagenome]